MHLLKQIITVIKHFWVQQSSAMMIAIFFSGQIDCSDSHFSYSSGMTCSDYQHPEFRPVFEVNFGMETEAQQAAEDMCSSAPSDEQRSFCIFDYFITGDPLFATTTLQTGIDETNIMKALREHRE